MSGESHLCVQASDKVAIISRGVKFCGNLEFAWWDFFWKVLVFNDTQRAWLDWTVDGGVCLLEIGAEIKCLLEKDDITKSNFNLHDSTFFNTSLDFAGGFQVQRFANSRWVGVDVDSVDFYQVCGRV